MTKRKAASTPDALAAACRRHRRRLGMTQAAVAHAAGISFDTYNRIEGAKANPRLSMLGALANVFGAPARELL